MSIKDELTGIMSADSVFDDEATRIHYSRDQSFVDPRKPDLVVFAETVPQIREDNHLRQ